MLVELRVIGNLLVKFEIAVNHSLKFVLDHMIKGKSGILGRIDFYTVCKGKILRQFGLKCSINTLSCSVKSCTKLII